MSWQINKFWNKVSNEDVNLNDIEEYIYSSEYLKIQAENSHDGFCVNDISAGNQIKIVFKLRDGINK